MIEKATQIPNDIDLSVCQSKLKYKSINKFQTKTFFTLVFSRVYAVDVSFMRVVFSFNFVYAPIHGSREKCSDMTDIFPTIFHPLTGDKVFFFISE